MKGVTNSGTHHHYYYPEPKPEPDHDLVQQINELVKVIAELKQKVDCTYTKSEIESLIDVVAEQQATIDRQAKEIKVLQSEVNHIYGCDDDEDDVEDEDDDVEVEEPESEDDHRLEDVYAEKLQEISKQRIEIKMRDGTSDEYDKLNREKAEVIAHYSDLGVGYESDPEDYINEII